MTSEPVGTWTAQRAALIQSTQRLGVAGRDAVRLADLFLARAYSEALDLLPPALSHPNLQPNTVTSALADVALFPLPQITPKYQGLTKIVDQALKVSSIAAPTADLLYQWSASSQEADPGRKGRGAYSTPPQLAEQMAWEAIPRPTPGTSLPRIFDPSAGHGALLLAAFLRLKASGVDAAAASQTLYGVELDPHARELCCLMLWLAGAGDAGVDLNCLSSQVILGNTLTAMWSMKQPSEELPGLDVQAPHPLKAFVWEEAFRDVFRTGGFDVVLMNPPWESLRHRPEANAENWGERDATRERLSRAIPTQRAELPPLYSKQGRGDRNLYKGFVELVPHLLREGGTLVALIPGAFASDLGMTKLRRLFLDHMAIRQWTGFENLAGYFPIDGRYKFGVLIAHRSPNGTRTTRFRFLARNASEISKPTSHVSIRRPELGRLGGQTAMFPEVVDRREVEILLRAIDIGTAFFDASGSFGEIQYRREVDLTLDRDSFIHARDALEAGYVPSADGSWQTDRGDELVPLIEGRMVGAHNFFQKSWRSGQGRSARWTENRDLPLEQCQPQYLAARPQSPEPRLAICDVTSATNTRTMLAAWIPQWRCGNTAPVLAAESGQLSLALLAVLNSMTFDWILRRIAAGLHLNRFYLEAMPLPSLDDEQLAIAADFAAATLSRDLRFQALSKLDRDPLHGYRAVTAVPASTLEALVARGFGLQPADLEHMLRPDIEDRKGMWRYFAAEPEARRIAERSVQELAAA